MKPLINALIALFLVLAPSSNGNAETVAEFIERASNLRNFGDDMMHPEGRVLTVLSVSSMKVENAYSRAEIAEIAGVWVPTMKDYKVTNLEIIQETVMSEFVSVVYSLNYEIVGDMTVSGFARILSILQKRGSTYRTVFAVQIE